MLDLQVRFRFQHLAHADAIELLVGLGARRPYGRPAAGVEQAELNAGGVDHLAHQAAQGVNLAHQVALGDAADGGVAGHLRDEVQVHGAERRAQPHARRRHSSLATGVAGADYDHIEFFFSPWHLCIS